jgi:hypothetical protein
MTSNMSTIGFEAGSADDFRRLAERAVAQGRWVESPHGRYAVWPTSGPEQLWIGVDERGVIVGLNPHFEGSATIRVGIVQAVRDLEHPMDGHLSCWADPADPSPDSGLYPFLVDLPDFDAATEAVAAPALATMQIAAFARTLTCWPDDAAYTAQEEARWSSREGPEDRPVKGFAAESFIPSGMFALDPSKPHTPKAEAIFTGHVLDTRVLVNGLTGRSFRHALVRTLGGESDVVADPEVVKGEPAVGGVVQGSFWLSGRLVGLEVARPSSQPA